MDEIQVLPVNPKADNKESEKRSFADRRANIYMLSSSPRESGSSALPPDTSSLPRKQARSSMAVPLWLTSLDHPGELDWTITENVSECGARIISKRRWRVNESVLVSLPPKFTATGHVVYCQSLPSGNYVLGIAIGESSEAWLKSIEGAA
jgi:hypothetical protein